MSKNKVSSTPFKITFTGFSESNLKALKVYFSDHAAGRYEISKPINSQIHIVDVEMTALQQEVEHYSSKYPQATIIYVSSSTLKYAKLLLNKPLKLSTLIKALDKVAISINQSAQQKSAFPKAQVIDIKTRNTKPSPLLSELKKQTSKKKPSVGFSHELELQNKHIQSVANEHDATRFWGVRWNIKMDEPVSEFYTPNHFLQGHVLNAVKQAYKEKKPIQLDTQFQSIIVLPQAHKIMLNCKDSRMQFACLQKMRRKKVGERCDYKSHKSAHTETYWLNNPEFCSESIDNVLWKLALWTSRGRLPGDLTPDTPYKLRQWPNFTRLQSEAYMLSLSAIMVNQSATIHDLSNKLKLPSGFICQFLSAVQSLDLIEQQPGDSQQAIPWPEHNGSKSNFISRLFKRLAG